MIEEFAPAKVNLYLHVVGKRDDGYHLLDSLAVFAGVGDRLRFADGDGLSLVLEGPGAQALQALPDNIVVKAGQKLAALAGVPARATVTLAKHLPVAAGIGGGSADAAAALRGLCRLWNISPDAQALSALALSLGADVPVCLAGRATRMMGVGENLEPAPALPPVWMVLVNPRQALSTPAVFKARDGGFSQPMPLLAPPADAAALAGELALRRNDLMPPAMRLAPVVGVMLDAIGRETGCLLARMSGSGATCFGLFAAEDSARAAAASLAKGHPGWWIAPAPVLA